MDFYNIKNNEEYLEAYQASMDDPEKFWGDLATENFVWNKKWDKVLEHDLSKAQVKWFLNARLNITENCLDRHLNQRPDKTAILWEPNDPEEDAQKISYKTLHQKVCQMANVLKDKGVKKGDRVCLYLPMIPELAIAVLACARIGAVHSVVFAGFSAAALASRINDCEAHVVITADGAFRGKKILDLKAIVDNALKDNHTVRHVLVAERTLNEITLKSGRDLLLNPLLVEAASQCEPEIMDAEDPLFILYTSGSTGKPKGMMHTTAGYMVYAAYTFKNIFRYQENDIYWCTADIGWITGHTYIVYGPLANGATTVMFEGIPTWPDSGRFWEIVAKHRVNQFYTAPTAIRALAKEPIQVVEKHDLSSLRVLGTVGEPINEEAWNWYDQNIGKGKCPIADTWWQTETGGIMISGIPFCTEAKPTFATLPFPGIKPVLLDEDGKERTEQSAQGKLCISKAWPSMARTIWGDHQRYIDTYFSAFPGYYFTGDGALRDEDGNYRITGRVDDVIIVSGHNLGTAPIEDAINEHPAVAESAVVGFPHEIKGNALCGFVILKETEQANLAEDINKLIASQIGPIAKLERVAFVPGLPKTRSGKIMRRILRKIASNETSDFGDISTLLNPDVVQQIVQSYSPN